MNGKRNGLKRMAWQKYVFVLFVTVAIFLFGILLGSYTSTQKLQQVSDLQNDLRTQTMDTEMQYSLVQENPCAFINTTPLTNELYDLSVRLDFMENVLGPDNTQVIGMKSYYSLLELRQWLFMKQLDKTCGTNRTLVLYFYSNAKGECPECQEQGFILTWLRKNYPDVQIFSFDKNLPVTSLATLEQQYGVNETPFIVVNDRPYAGFQSKNALLLAVLDATNATMDTGTMQTALQGG